jgi:hypothetical protein
VPNDFGIREMAVLEYSFNRRSVPGFASFAKPLFVGLDGILMNGHVRSSFRSAIFLEVGKDGDMGKLKFREGLDQHRGVRPPHLVAGSRDDLVQ